MARDGREPLCGAGTAFHPRRVEWLTALSARPVSARTPRRPTAAHVHRTGIRVRPTSAKPAFAGISSAVELVARIPMVARKVPRAALPTDAQREYQRLKPV